MYIATYIINSTSMESTAGIGPSKRHKLVRLLIVDAAVLRRIVRNTSECKVIHGIRHIVFVRVLLNHQKLHEIQIKPSQIEEIK